MQWSCWGSSRVFSYFDGCVEERGDMTDACWYDPPSIKLGKIPGSVVQEVYLAGLHLPKPDLLIFPKTSVLKADKGIS